MSDSPGRRGRRAAAAGVEPLESRQLMSVSELVRNGSFEGPAVSSDWVAGGLFQADSRFTNYHSGLGYAYLSDASGNAANSVSGSLYQQLTIPASAGPLSLSFWTKITTAETTTTAANDVMSVQITDATGANVLQTVTALSNLNASSGYVRRAFALSNVLKGQTVRVVFNASTNASAATTFRVDDVGLSASSPDLTRRVVGYLPGYRQGNFGQLDLNLVTWLNYFSVSVNSDGSLTTSNVSDTNLATVVSAAHAKGVGVSITVGPQSFATVAADANLRNTFATNIVNYITARNLDGVDIDWEPPATGTNQANYALLIGALYARTSPLGLKITAACNPLTHEIPVAATNQMDWVNVMCYDFDYANHSTYTAAVNGMNGWATYGVAKDKLVMGVPFYGRYGTSWSDTHAKTYATILSDYKTLNGAYPSPDVDSYTDAAGHTTYFNGIATVEKKMAFVRDNSFGGAMVWELGQDHWDSSAKYDPYSLLPVVSSMLRPPTWLTPASGSMFYLVNKQFFAGSGTVTFSGNIAATTPGLSVSLGSGATAILGTTQKIAALAISAGGTLDVKDKDLVIDYSGSTSVLGSWSGSAYTGVTGLIASGRNNGTWGGSGIITSMAAAGGATPLTTIGAANSSFVLGLSGSATAVWNGQTVDSTCVLIKYTYAGDANLDGHVDIDDYTQIDSNMAVGGSMKGWANGDFNYDGVIDIDDYTIIDSTIGMQGSPL